MLPFFVPLESAEWQDDLLVLRIVPNFEPTILGLCWIIALPLLLGWFVIS